jgi:phage gp37-like protein
MSTPDVTAYRRVHGRRPTSVEEGIRARLEYLRGQIEAEVISYGEIAELQDLAEHIDPSDVVLLQWAGVPEGDARGTGRQPLNAFESTADR